MFTEKKFRSLDNRLQYRKAALILREAESASLRGEDVDFDYITMIVNTAFREEKVNPGFFSTGEISRKLSNLRFCAMERGGIQVADWDLNLASDDAAGFREKLPVSVYLEDLRSPFNVGSVFRSAESFGFSEILLSEYTPTPEHPRAKRSAMGTDSVLDWRVCSPADLEGKPLFALETDGCPIEEFRFPEKGIMILGSEETGVSRELLEMAEKSLGIVSIPMAGIKKSINVGVAFGIAAYYWTSAIRSGLCSGR